MLHYLKIVLYCYDKMATREYITLAHQDEFHPELNINDNKTMGYMRMLAFHVLE